MGYLKVMGLAVSSGLGSLSPDPLSYFGSGSLLQGWIWLWVGHALPALTLCYDAGRHPSPEAAWTLCFTASRTTSHAYFYCSRLTPFVCSAAAADN